MIPHVINNFFYKHNKNNLFNSYFLNYYSTLFLNKKMKSSKNEINGENNVQPEVKVAEQIVRDFLESSNEQEVHNLLVTTENCETSQPSCSWQETKNEMVQSPQRKSTIIVIPKVEPQTTDSIPVEPKQHGCQNPTHIFENHAEINLPQTVQNQQTMTSTCLNSNPDSLKNSENNPNPTSINISMVRQTGMPPTANPGIPIVNLHEVPLSRAPIQPQPSAKGPPPSYSKSLLDRRINPCASIQFVAPIPPPSYDGMDNELRYCGGAQSGFTLGLGNTWQMQPQPAFCPVCETVIITRVEVKISRVAHLIALIMCIFLCWPFCVLPYFINICNYTYHFCSVCHWYLGARKPFQRS